MEWEVYKLKQTGGRTAPFVSIGRGALDFSQAACELINDNGTYKQEKKRAKPLLPLSF